MKGNGVGLIFHCLRWLHHAKDSSTSSGVIEVSSWIDLRCLLFDLWRCPGYLLAKILDSPRPVSSSRSGVFLVITCTMLARNTRESYSPTFSNPLGRLHCIQSRPKFEPCRGFFNFELCEIPLEKDSRYSNQSGPTRTDLTELTC